MGYIAVGIVLWLFANASGAHLGPEHILTLPAMLGLLFVMGLMFL